MMVWTWCLGSESVANLDGTGSLRALWQLPAMAVSIPQPSFPPPTSALPLLPAPKGRKSVANSSDATRLPSLSYNASSKLAVRTPSKPLTSPTSPIAFSAHSTSTPTIPTLRSLTIRAEHGLGSPERDIRRSVSIASFPQPPKVGRRLPSEPKNFSSLPSPVPEPQKKRAMENTNSPRILTGSLKAKKPKRSTDHLAHLFNPSETPSLLNGSGDGKSISGAAGARGSDGVTSLLSPSQSRSSSAQGSYSTSATTFEDVDENMKRAHKDAEDRLRTTNRLSDPKEARGNVIVSVRVKPDTVGSGDQKSEGEWMVDGRRSLVAYRGRERGDYYFGESRCNLMWGEPWLIWRFR